MDTSVGLLIVYLVAALLVFLVCREIVCWYFKLNEIVSVLRQIRDRLVKELKLSEDQQQKLEPILGDSRQQFMALQGLPEPDRRAKAQKIREAARVRIREILTDEQRVRYDEMSGAPGGDGRSGVAGRVWIVGPEGKPAPLTLAVGLSDGTATEVLRGELKEGQEVIVGLAGGSGRGAQPQQGAPRLRL